MGMHDKFYLGAWYGGRAVDDSLAIVSTKLVSQLREEFSHSWIQST